MLIKEYLNEAINLELNVSKLYLLFSKINDFDYNFWYKLSIEEGGHAAILKNILYSYKLIEYDFNISEIELNELKQTNEYILKLLKTNEYSRRDCFRIAINIENSAGEIHYQNLLDNDKIDDKIMKTFLKLNKEDDRHLEKITLYAQTHNINYE